MFPAYGTLVIFSCLRGFSPAFGARCFGSRHHLCFTRDHSPHQRTQILITTKKNNMQDPVPIYWANIGVLAACYGYGFTLGRPDRGEGGADKNQPKWLKFIYKVGLHGLCRLKTSSATHIAISARAARSCYTDSTSGSPLVTWKVLPGPRKCLRLEILIQRVVVLSSCSRVCYALHSVAFSLPLEVPRLRIRSGERG